MEKILNKIIFPVFISLILMLPIPFTSSANVLSPELESALSMLPPEEELSVIVTLADKVDLTLFKDKDKGIRRANIIKALQNKATMAQPPLRAFLASRGVKRIQPFWIINGMAVTARAEVIQELAGEPGIESIRLDETLSAPVLTYGTSTAPEWNLSLIAAPELWNLGYTGTGIVVASMDTGVDINHPDLSSKWRGGSNSWFDPNGEHATPYDKSGHGTQTMGIIIGGDAGGTAIGVAPGAQWIAVKIFNDAGSASWSVIHQGFQWLLDPDNNPNSNDAPDIANNSWGLSNSAGECILEFQNDIQALKAAEIAVVFSGGNEGPYPMTSISPANYPESFAVGAVDQYSAIANFSSRGPSACYGDYYPQVVAPGVNVRTSDLTLGGVFPNSYAYVSGTSFAAPHVAGALALLLGAVPDASISALESALTESALDLAPFGPDDDSGYGVIDVAAAYSLLSPMPPPQCPDADGDGFDATADCGGPVDCDDTDPNVYPGAPEIKHDGIDQDCNGYDLTINILSATYGARKDTLAVSATSNLGQTANLQLTGYGSMRWDRKKSLWSISLTRVGGNPGTITVSGIEGSESAQTIVK